MNRINPVVMLLSLSMLLPLAHGESISDETLSKCAAYYQVLATAGNLKDISSKDSSRAFYAFQKKLPSAKRSTVVERMVAMRDEIAGRMTEAGIADFRNKYDPECKALLVEVWCDAFGEADKNACKR